MPHAGVPMAHPCPQFPLSSSPRLHITMTCKTFHNPSPKPQKDRTTSMDSSCATNSLKHSADREARHPRASSHHTCTDTSCQANMQSISSHHLLVHCIRHRAQCQRSEDSASNSYRETRIIIKRKPRIRSSSSHSITSHLLTPCRCCKMARVRYSTVAAIVSSLGSPKKKAGK